MRRSRFALLHSMRSFPRSYCTSCPDALLYAFCRSTIAFGDQSLIKNVKEGKLLARLLHGMEKSRDTHLRNGGSVASILVGRFRISQRRNDVGGGNLPPERSSFKLPKELNEYFGGCPELVVRLGSDRDSPLLRAQFCHTPVQRQNSGQKGLTLDVRAACPDLVLDYREAPINLERHRCCATHGMHSFFHRSMACGDDASPDILCALFIRDGQPKAWNVALSLNLDKPRNLEFML